jgi:hypothetical protein
MRAWGDLFIVFAAQPLRLHDRPCGMSVWPIAVGHGGLQSTQSV